MLSNTKNTGFFNFQVGPVLINFSAYKEISKLILDRKIVLIQHNSPFDTYNYQTNTMTLRDWDTTSLSRRGLIIHEATHAIHDHSCAAGILNEEFEAAGFLAQAMFGVKHGITMEDADSGRRGQGLASAIAVVESWGNRWPKKISQDDLKVVIEGIETTGDYPELKQKIVFDGVKVK